MHIPQKTITYEVYANGSERMTGTAVLTPPPFESSSDTIKTSAGEYNVPTVGIFGSLPFSLTFVDANESVLRFAEGTTQRFSCRASKQRYDTAAAQIIKVPLRIDLTVIITSCNSGNVEVAASSEGTISGETMIYQHWIDGKEWRFYDRENMIYRVDGVDQWAEIRSHIGR